MIEQWSDHHNGRHSADIPPANRWEDTSTEKRSIQYRGYNLGKALSPDLRITTISVEKQGKMDFKSSKSLILQQCSIDIC